MASNMGIATIDFGGFPGSNEAQFSVTGQTSIQTTSYVAAFIMADDSTLDHTQNDHKYVGMFLTITCGQPVTNTGFTIYVKSPYRMEGTFKIRWGWSD